MALKTDEPIVDVPEMLELILDAVDFLLRCGGALSSVFMTCWEVATGSESPRSLPLLATPTPQVKVVLYPEHSFPLSRHCEQYGLFLSQGTAFFRHEKQSSAAPDAAVLRLRFRGADEATVSDVASEAVGMGASAAMLTNGLKGRRCGQNEGGLGHRIAGKEESGSSSLPRTGVRCNGALP